MLKGALLFSVWYDEPHRPTRDADLLGFGQDDSAHLVALFSELAGMDMHDGIVLDPASVCADAIREDNFYGGIRIYMIGRVGSARCTLQVDVGFGDAVTPGPRETTFPTLLEGFDPPRLKAYPVYTVIAEKYQAMVMLGQANSRMKDFYDLAVIARRAELEGATLAKAIAATFGHRATPIPAERPLALTSSFAADVTKLQQWQAFLNKNRLAGASLAETIALLDQLLWPATQVAAAGSDATASWLPAVGRWALA